MAEIVKNSWRAWGGDRDDEGWRTWWIKFRVEVNADEGPYAALLCPGLPQPGDLWDWSLDTPDVWAWCRPGVSVEAAGEYQEGEKPNYFDLRYTFSNKPLPPSVQRCTDTTIEDPLLEPPRISGGSIKYTEEASVDRFGVPIRTSSWEQVRGPKVEFDNNRRQYRIEMNVSDLDEALFAPAQDTVNKYPIWGFPVRSVKLSDAPWEKIYYGSCNVYYRYSLVFDVNVKRDPLTGNMVSGFDRDILDEGTKALNGQWNKTTGDWELLDISDAAGAPDRFNPAHFIRLKDRQGENMRTVLNGAGEPIDDKIMGAVENVANETPIVVTSTDHGLETGDVVAIEGIRPGFQEANGVFYVIPISGTGTGGADSFEIYTIVADEETGEFVEVVSVEPEDLFSEYKGGGFWVKIGRIDAEGFFVKEGPGNIHVEKYDETDFLLLGVPADLTGG